ncbi:MAG: methyl-accepting chemotaxis protein [Planctomycetota bacterium]
MTTATTLSAPRRGWLRRRLSVRLRLLGLLALATGMAAWLTLSVLDQLQQVNASFQEVAGRHLPASEQLGRLRQSFLRAVVAERSLLFQSTGSEDAASGRAEHDASVADAGDAWSQLAQAAPDLAAGSAFAALFETWRRTSYEVLEILAEDTPAARRDAIDLSMTAGQQAVLAVRNELDAVTARTRTRVASASATAADGAARVATVTRTQLYVGIAVIAVLGLWIVRTVARPLRLAATALDRVASGQGDLRHRLDERAFGEVGDLAASFNLFLRGLRQMVQQIRDTATRVHGAADELGEASRSFQADAESMQRRSTDTDQAARHVLEMTQQSEVTTGELNSSIRGIAESSQGSAERAAEGARQVATTWDLVDRMGRDSENIRRALDVVESIARQTNMLSLNAAVEAARAGEAGAGFAVVAARVKQLAQESAKATVEISGYVDEFLERVATTVASIDQIKVAVAGIDTASAECAASVEEQSAVTQEFADSFRTIRRSSEQIRRETGTMRELAAASNERAARSLAAAATLTDSAGELTALVGRFQL